MNQLLKKHNGITLVALIITISILLILSAVAIRTVTGNGIISHAKNEDESYSNMQDEEELKLSLLKWKTINKTNKSQDLYTFMQKRFGKDKVKKIEKDTVVVTLENGKQYNVTSTGDVTSIKGIVLSKNKLALELKNGKTITEELSATLNELSGNITWSIPNENVIKLSGTTGNNVTVTAVSTGVQEITVKCKEYSTKCKVIVENAIDAGTYVNYNVPYIDMYSGIEYTASNGWRYLGKDDNGNKLIVSTAIPALLHYSCYTNTGNTEDGGKNSWWATKEELSLENTPSIYRTDTKTYSQEPNRYAAYGLRYKFEEIEFGHSTTNENAVANEGIYRKIGTQESGKLSNAAFRANGVNIVNVHNLTLVELNRAMNNVTGSKRADNLAIACQFKSLTGSALGLFDMSKLENYTQSYWYWLSWPYVNNPNILLLSSGGSDIANGNSRSYGVRPVITLAFETKLVDTNNDGVLEINSLN